MKYYVEVGERTREVEVFERMGELVVTVDGEAMDLTYEEADRLGQVVLLHAGKSYAISIEGDSDRVGVTLAGHHYELSLEDERERAAHQAERETSSGGGSVDASMPGVVVEVLVEEGQAVTAGQPLLILEAMKMQNEIAAPADGRVERIVARAGVAVAAGDPLVALVPLE